VIGLVAMPRVRAELAGAPTRFDVRELTDGESRDYPVGFRNPFGIAAAGW